MNLNEAFKKAVKSYFDDNDEFESSKDRKYVKSYFDSIEKEFGLSKEAEDEDELSSKKRKK